ncbi:signal recognition particle receptor subunit alpha homolog [Rhizophagus irregularis DAOM 181602=DAOM 197198]|nr:signal recognition particle receptor subunit alpha homolog [Rhizophagus irregularis DAOM 181602=DAOM 197198]
MNDELDQFAFLFFAGILEIRFFILQKHEERSNNITSDMEDAAYLLADLTRNHNSTNLSKTCTKWIKGRFDTFRSGAVEQLRVHVALGQNSNTLLLANIYSYITNKFDIVLIDTAGHVQDSELLMRALAKTYRWDDFDTADGGNIC